MPPALLRAALVALVALIGARPATAAPDRQSAETLTQLAAVAAADVDGTEVLSSRDIEEIVKLEADKQLLGCDDDSSCLAEVAGALGARYVVFSQLGQLDDTLVLTLNLFDGEEARSVGRQVVRGETVSEVGEQVAAAVQTLLGEAMGKRPEDETEAIRVLVMDIRIAGTTAGEGATPEAAADEPPAASGLLFPGLLIGGGALGLVAVGLGVTGVVFGMQANGTQALAANPETKQTEVPALVVARDLDAAIANGTLFGAGVAAVAAGGLVAAAFLVGSQE